MLPSLARWILRNYPGRVLALALLFAGLALLSPRWHSAAEEPKGSSDLKLPDGYRVVSPEEWQRIQEKLAQLEALLKPEKPVGPSSCKISGKIDGDVAHLRAHFGFGTLRPKATVLLGCSQGLPSAVTLDGQATTAFAWSENGWTVQVEKEGSHEIDLDMDVPLEARDADRGFELALPRPNVKLELEVPGHAKTVRAGNRTLTTSPVDDHTGKIDARLGALEKLEVFWESPSGRPPAAPSFAVDGRMLVRLSGSTVQAQVTLTIRVLAGKPDQFRLQVPGQADRPVSTDPILLNRVQSIEPDPNASGWWIVKLKGPGTEPVHLEVSYTQARAGASTAVAGVMVAGAVRQRGSLLVSKTADLQLRYTPKSDNSVTVNPREVTEEDRKQDANVAAAFSYWNLLNSDKPAPSLLQIDVEKIKPAIEAHLIHSFTLSPQTPDALAWHLHTQLDLTLSHNAGTEVFIIQLPLDFHYDSKVGVQPTLPGQNVELLEDKHQLRITIEKLAGKHSLSFEGSYSMMNLRMEETTLKLPVPVGMLDRGAEVKIEVPRSFKLVPAHPDDPTWDAILPDIHPESSRSLQKHSWTARRIPELAEFAWRAYQPELPASSWVELLLGDRKIHVVQSIQVRCLQGTVERLLLRVPPELVERVAIAGEDGKKLWLAREGQRLETRDGMELWRLEFKADSARGGLTLRYFIAMPDEKNDARPYQELSVPLVVPEEVNGERVTSLDTVVQVFGRPGVLALPLGDRWNEMRGDLSRELAAFPSASLQLSTSDGVEKLLPGKPRLQGAPPAYVLHAHGSDVPLKIRITPAADAGLATALVEAMLVRVQVADDGGQSYRVGLRLGPLRGPALDLEVPAPAAAIGLKIFLRSAELGPGLRPVAWGLLEQSGQANSRLVRLDLDPDVILKQAILEVEYHLPPPHSAAVRWQSVAQPIKVRGDLGSCATTWLISFPPTWLPLVQQGALSEDMGWGLRGWLVGPQATPSRTALEQWLDPAGHAAADEDGASRALVLHGTGPATVHVTHVPQQLWLLTCSLALLAWVLALWRLSMGAPAAGRLVAFWAVLLPVLLAGVVVALLWPSLLAALVYGLEPGIGVLCVVAAVHWAVQRRYRRQVVFMPGFQRIKTDSSLVRSSQQRKRPEPSKVELPHVIGGAWAAEGAAPGQPSEPSAQQAGSPS